MASVASDAFTAWVRGSIAPIAHGHDLAGTGPVFRKRAGAVWTVFAIERRRLDPREASRAAGQRQVEFRLIVGFAVPATRLAWDRRSGPPGMHDVAMHAPTRVFEPPVGRFWHVFDIDDVAGQERMTRLIGAGLGEALHALGEPDPRAILIRKRAHMGPLENLSPGAAGELLALADLAGEPDMRIEIAEALKRPRVADPEREQALRGLMERSAEAFGPAAQVLIPRRRPDDEITLPLAGRRRTPTIRARLISELDAERSEVRRLAAAALGGWDGDSEVLDALRRALDNADDFAAACAARSLGHLGDGDETTWRRSLGLAATTAAAPAEVAEAIVLLARQDPNARREPGAQALRDMVVRFPAVSRRLAALIARLSRAEGL